MSDYEHSAEVAELMEALATAQTTMMNPTKDSTNQYSQSRYASLAAVRDACVPPLAAQGIAVTQVVTTEDKAVSCTTILWHKSGQYLANTLRLPVLPMPRRRQGGHEEASMADGNPLGPQAYGIAMTYARRYGLMALCNIAGDDDTDGEVAGGTRSSTEKERRASAPAGVHPVTGEIDPADEPRLTLLRFIHGDLTEIVRPLKHAGLFKAVVYHSFGVEPAALPHQSLETLERGIGLFRHLCDQLAITGKPPMPPDEWIGIKVRELAAATDELAAEEEGEPATATSDLWQQEEAAERGEV